MNPVKLTLDLDRLQVVSYATHDAERRDAAEERDDACPAASATLTARAPQ